MEERVLLGARQFFDARAHSYSDVSRWAYSESLNRLTEEMLTGAYGQVAVDVGAGTGVQIMRLAGFRRRYAVDISMGMLALIRDSGVARVCGDIECLGLRDNMADVVICRQVLHYCNLNRSVGELRRLMKVGALLHVVQVIDFRGVPESWDQKWTGFRKVGGRRHLRRAVLEKSFGRHQLELAEYRSLVLRDRYSWHDFFLKHRIRGHREEKAVRSFFAEAPKAVIKAIGLVVEEEYIAYNRLFGAWLLKKN